MFTEKILRFNFQFLTLTAPNLNTLQVITALYMFLFQVKFSMSVRILCVLLGPGSFFNQVTIVRILLIILGHYSNLTWLCSFELCVQYSVLVLNLALS